jgi:hypothetical protein
VRLSADPPCATGGKRLMLSVVGYLSNGFSRKTQNHAAATALNYFAYNFIKIHRTLRMSPAMAAGVTDRLWDVNDLVALWESYEQSEGGKSGIGANFYDTDLDEALANANRRNCADFRRDQDSPKVKVDGMRRSTPDHGWR